jgi:hypothetical protein
LPVSSGPSGARLEHHVERTFGRPADAGEATFADHLAELGFAGLGAQPFSYLDVAR